MQRCEKKNQEPVVYAYENYVNTCKLSVVATTVNMDIYKRSLRVWWCWGAPVLYYHILEGYCKKYCTGQFPSALWSAVSYVGTSHSQTDNQIPSVTQSYRRSDSFGHSQADKQTPSVKQTTRSERRQYLYCDRFTDRQI
jgi:hypothetical protein